MPPLTSRQERTLELEAAALTMTRDGRADSPWWIAAAIGTQPEEDRVLVDGALGRLAVDHRQTFLFAVGEGGREPNGAAQSLWAILSNMLRGVSLDDPLRGDNSRQSARDDRATIAERFIGRLRRGAALVGLPDEAVESTSIAIVFWPDCFCFTGAGTHAFVMHDERLLSIGGAMAPRGDNGCSWASRASQRPTAQPSASVVRASLAFGDSLFLCTPAVSDHISPSELARTLRGSTTASIASQEIVDNLARSDSHEPAALLTARFYFRSAQRDSRVHAARG